MFRSKRGARDSEDDVGFDEDGYLRANPDVAAAVASGALESGEAHWRTTGRSEGRALSPAQSRNEIVRSHLDVTGRGIELGPLDKPIMAKRDGHLVEIVDYLDTAGLRERYGAELHVGVDASLIEEVDHVSHGQSLTELIGNEGSYEWIMASHVIEHIPDLVSFLQDVEQMLSPTGRLGLVIHSTAGFIDAGFDGHVTLELANLANLPITLYPGMKIGQISFIQMTSPAEKPYGSGAHGSKYQGQRGPTPSRYFENFKR